jgi:antirestriction protein ArdC
MQVKHARRISEQAFNKLIEAVEAGKSHKLVEYLRVMGRFHNYSLGNAILIGFQRPDATRVAGYRTWQKLGRFVKKGENGIAIMAPIVYRRKIGTEETDGKETEDETVTTFKTAHVFDVSQTEGKPLPDFAKVGGDPGIYAEKLREYVASRGIKLEYSEAIGAAEGISSGGLIRLKKGLSTADEFSVLVHELAHEMVHKNRDSMPKDTKFRETEAEAVAFVVCHGVGLDASSASSDYIQLYDGDKKTLLQSLERIQRTAAEILAAITENGESRVQAGSETICLITAA